MRARRTTRPLGWWGSINNFRYADDTALVADREEILQKIVNKVKEQSENLGLYMNVSKTKTMMVNKAGGREERGIYSNRCRWSRIKTSKGL